MIGKAFRLIPTEFTALTPRLIAAIVAQALSQAAAYVLLVPLLEAVFDDELSRAWFWVAMMAIAVASMGVFGYLQAAIGLRIAVGMQLGLQTRLGDKLNALPLGWFETRSAAPLSRMVVEDVRDIQQVLAYLTAKLVTSILVPVGVAIGMLFIDWRVALAMLIAAPVLFGINRLASRGYQRSDARLHAAAAEADTRVVEFAQVQPVLRAFGAIGRGNTALATALSRQKSAKVGKRPYRVHGGARHHRLRPRRASDLSDSHLHRGGTGDSRNTVGSGCHRPHRRCRTVHRTAQSSRTAGQCDAIGRSCRRPGQ